MTDTTDPREGGSEHAGLLRNLDFAAAEFDAAIYEDAAAAIRALEAKVRELEADEDQDELDIQPPPSRTIKLVRMEKHEELRADRDRLTSALAVEQRVCKGWQETAEKFRGERDRLAEQTTLLEQHIALLKAENAHYLIGRDRLAGEVERLTKLRESDADVIALRAANESLTSELAAAREDAERWRFHLSTKSTTARDFITRAIDAARRAGEGEK